MNDPRAMRRRRRIGNLHRVSQCLAEPQSSFADQRIKRFAFDVLHRDEVDAVDPVDIVDRDDVRMVQRRGRLRFLSEPLTAFFVGDETLR